MKRLRIAGRLRNGLRRRFFGFMAHVLSLTDTRRLLSETLRSQNFIAFTPSADGVQLRAPPYPEIGRAGSTKNTRERDDIVFVTGRFRSGSTLAWNLFRGMPQVTAYYEPFNERRWFDADVRGESTDATHRNVSDYWSEFAGLDCLGEFHRRDWTYRRLYMSPEAWDPGMQRYIELLIEHAPGRPVLQENRIDFRLPWLRARFPNCKIVHIFRNPRDQWLSSLGRSAPAPRDITIGGFEPWDRFYLLPWGQDLENAFPFLTLRAGAHPYELFYQIWRLSYLFGLRYSDSSICFEDLNRNPVAEIERLCAALAIDADPQVLAAAVVRMPTNTWEQYADQDWFAQIESRVEHTLADFFDQRGG